ncbi:MAG: hypothetical protein ABIX46_02690, partial [Burkholderiaceae bacterium]
MSRPHGPTGESRRATATRGPVPAAATLDRRAFLAAGGGLVVALALPSASFANDGTGAGLAPERLDSWLAIDAQGRVLASVG